MWAFAHSSRLRWRTSIRSRPRWGQRACRWASLRRFLTVCAEILWLRKPIVAAAVRVASLRRSWRWRYWMWRSCAGVVTHGLQLWGRLDVLPNSLKRLWRCLMVEKWTFNSRKTALVDIPAVSMPNACFLKPCNICGIILCDETARWAAHRADYICYVLPASLDPLQLANHSKCSTDDAIAFTLHTALSHLENKNTYVRMLFVDYSSAFNTIVPATLVAKLQTLGLNRSLCSWILDFLTGRSQVVRMGNNTSSPLILITGAPQGCVLSPLLYSRYTHDCTATHS